MKYTQDALQIWSDPLPYIRSQPQRFLRSVSGMELATTLASQIHLLVPGSFEIRRMADWWVVVSEVDWFQAPSAYPITELFSRLLPFPRAGANSIRAEILLSAFAERIVTATPTAVEVVKGVLSPEESSVLFTSQRPWARIVAFQMADGENRQ